MTQLLINEVILLQLSIIKFKHMQLKLILLCLFSITLANITINPEKKQFVDQHGRLRVFHGINAVYKLPPYMPSDGKFDAATTLDDNDFKLLQGWGMNFIRLGVLWEAVEPVKGQYNVTYLDEVVKMVRDGAKYGIYFLIDAHQDLGLRKYCGEGFPAYVGDSQTSLHFPEPAFWVDLDYDKDGNPTWDSCLKYEFGVMYPSCRVSEMFDNIYTNKDGLQDSFAAFWKLTASYFTNEPNVLGYELLNEPWVGNIYHNPLLLLRGQTSKLLQPMYEKIHEAIRQVDDKKMIFFEPQVFPYTGNHGFTDIPGGEAYADRNVWSFHIYCCKPSKGESACQQCSESLMDQGQKDAMSLKIPSFLTEFGAVYEDPFDLVTLDAVTTAADQQFVSWAYWQYKYFQDITTQMQPGSHESFFEVNGTIQQAKVDHLSKPYFYAICGSPLEFKFDSEDKVLSLTFEMAGDCNGKHTEMYARLDHFRDDAIVDCGECGCEWKAIGVDRYELILDDTCYEVNGAITMSIQ